MRPIIYLLIILIGFFTTSCKKDNVPIAPLASLNIVNAVIAGGNVKLNTVSDSAKMYNSKIFGVNTGSVNISVYSTDNNVSKPYFNNVFDIESGNHYSLFLGGQKVSVDGVLSNDGNLSYYSDSLIGIRVVNLSPNSNPLNITLASDTTKSIFTGIIYKQLTDFIVLPLPNPVPSGTTTFQVRDNSSNKLLATYTLPSSVNPNYPNISIQFTRFRNLTLVIKGLKDTNSGSDAFGVFPVANY